MIPTRRMFAQLCYESASLKLWYLIEETENYIKELSLKANTDFWREQIAVWEPDYEWRTQKTEFGRGLL